VHFPTAASGNEYAAEMAQRLGNPVILGLIAEFVRKQREQRALLQRASALE
jgi:hypothetical protein